MVWIRDFVGQGYSATPVLLRPFRRVYHFKRFKTNRLRAATNEIPPPAYECSVQELGTKYGLILNPVGSIAYNRVLLKTLYRHYFRLRYSAGVIPVCCLNRRVKYWGYSNPSSYAIWLIGRSSNARLSFAVSIIRF